MKVSMRKSEKTTGLFAKTTEYELFVKVELTAEERGAIKAAGIEKYILIEYSYKNMELNWTVSSVLHSSEKNSEWRFVTTDASQRLDLEAEVKQQLSNLKSQIESVAGGSREETFEL